jgi:CoA:oxalate CoA-transferase
VTETNSKTNREVLNKKRMLPSQGPLVGLRVLDYSQVIAAPYLGTLLSDMGAEVIKVEASYGDSGRGMGPVVNGEIGYFITQNRGKYGLAVDFTQPKAIELCKELTKVADIVIENWRPGVMTRRGLGYESCREINSNIIYATISGYGSFARYAPAPGPNSTRGAYDIVIQSETGHVWMNGFPDTPPHPLDIPWTDLHTGIHMATAIVAAVIHKQKTGRGQWIDIALSDTMVACNENLLAMVSMTDDKVPAPCRNGLRRLSMTPYGVFQAKDDYFVIGVENDKQFVRLCEAMKRPELGCDARFVTNHHRIHNRLAIEEIVEKWSIERTVAECVRILRDEHSVPAGPILTNMDYIKQPQIHAREMLVSLEQPRAGMVEVAGVVGKLSRSPGRVQGAAPLLGEHNRYLLKQYLGYSDKDIDTLYDELVIVDNIDLEYPAGVDIAKAKRKERGGESQ